MRRNAESKQQLVKRTPVVRNRMMNSLTREERIRKHEKSFSIDFGLVREIKRSIWICLLTTGTIVIRGVDSTDTATDEGYYPSFSTCKNSKIEIEEISILCSTPGEYYYGYNYYLNSETCNAGDKAKYEIIFNIPDELPEGYNVPYITVDVEGNGTVQNVRALDSEKFCDLDNLQSLDGSLCPAPGRYQVNNMFYWGAATDEYSYKFRPHMIIGLSSQQGSYRYNLGGANTESCEHGSYTNWSLKARRWANSTIHTFVVTMGVIFGACILGFSLYWFVKRKYRHQKKDQIQPEKEENLLPKPISIVPAVDNDDDYIDHDHLKRIAMMGREKDLIDA